MIIIGISGKKQSGKNTTFNIASKLIKSSHTLQFAFADGVKEEVSEATGIPISEMEKNKEVFRKIYQWWGTDFRRDLFGQDYWIKYLLKKIKVSDDLKLNDQVAFITDVRFKNEANWIKSVGGFLIRIHRNLAVTDFHLSETDLDNFTDWDYVILNNSSLDFLKIETLKALKHIRSKLSTHCHIV